MRLVKVRENVPREIPVENRGCPQRELEALVSRLGSVQVEQDVSRCIAAPNVVDDLILGLLAIEGCVEAKSIVEERQLGADLVRARKLRLQPKVGTREAIAVSTVRRRLEFERGTICIRTGILANFRICRAELSAHVAADRRNCIGENETGRNRWVEERVPLLGDR